MLQSAQQLVHGLLLGMDKPLMRPAHRSLQNEPFSAVFHDRFKLSTGARRMKFDQKFQLLAPGVLPVKHYSIWHRILQE